MTSKDAPSDVSGSAGPNLHHRLLTAYRVFGIAAGVSVLAYAVLLLITYLVDWGDDWTSLILIVLGAGVALLLTFVLHVVLSVRARLGWVHALVVIPLGIAAAWAGGPEILPGTADRPFWPIVTALAAPAVAGLLTAPRAVSPRRARNSIIAALLLLSALAADHGLVGAVHRAEIAAQAARCPDIPLLVPPPGSPWVARDATCLGDTLEVELARGFELPGEMVLELTEPGTPGYGETPVAHGAHVVVGYPEELGMPEDEFIASLEPVTVDQFAWRASRVYMLFRGGA